MFFSTIGLASAKMNVNMDACMHLCMDACMHGGMEA